MATRKPPRSPTEAQLSCRLIPRREPGEIRARPHQTEGRAAWGNFSTSARPPQTAQSILFAQSARQVRSGHGGGDGHRTDVASGGANHHGTALRACPGSPDSPGRYVAWVAGAKRSVPRSGPWGVDRGTKTLPRPPNLLAFTRKVVSGSPLRVYLERFHVGKWGQVPGVFARNLSPFPNAHRRSGAWTWGLAPRRLGASPHVQAQPRRSGSPLIPRREGRGGAGGS